MVDCSGRLVFIFYYYRKLDLRYVRHHTEPNIHILFTINLPFDSDIRRWSHPLMIALHCLWAKSNNITCGRFQCDVTLFWFCFDFFRSHSRCGCCSIVSLRFQVEEIKQVYCKMSNKNSNNYKYNIFRDSFGQLHTRKTRKSR